MLCDNSLSFKFNMFIFVFRNIIQIKKVIKTIRSPCLVCSTLATEKICWPFQGLFVFVVFLEMTKGQLISKADWRAIDSPKKRTGEFDLFAVKSKKANKTNSSFRFWENLWRANLLSKLTDL